MAIYRGFSTVNELSQKKFVLTDYKLVKQDLLNSFNTRKGSRLMQPQEGCIVWELMYKPLTEEIKQAMLENLIFIISQDPRLQLVDITLIDHCCALEEHDLMQCPKCSKNITRISEVRQPIEQDNRLLITRCSCFVIFKTFPTKRASSIWNDKLL